MSGLNERRRQMGEFNQEYVKKFSIVEVDRQMRKIYMDLLGGEVFTMLGSFFQNNHNLTNIKVFNCDFGDEGCRLFALAIGSNHNLTEINIEECNFGDEGGAGKQLNGVDLHEALLTQNYQYSHQTPVVTVDGGTYDLDGGLPSNGEYLNNFPS